MLLTQYIVYSTTEFGYETKQKVKYIIEEKTDINRKAFALTEL